jgi:multidrug efflux pump subunit AcrA (membrane-fusion protein)
MKNILYIIATSILILSCGTKKVDLDQLLSEGDITTLKEEKVKLAANQKEIKSQLDKIEAFLASQDTIKNFPLVTVFTAAPQVFSHYLELQGNVKTKQNVVIYPEMAGTLNRVLVSEGQKVSKGQLLASIDDGGMSQQVAQLEAQALLAKTTFERQKRLWEQQIGSEIQFLQAKTTFESSSNAVNQAKKQLGKSSIRAPFSGVIDEVITDQGTVVAPGQSAILPLI